LLNLICIVGLTSWSAGCSKPPVRVEPPPPKVTVAHVEVRPMVDYDDYNGWLDAVQSVELRARVRGHIQKVHFTDGQMVKKGDLLFELDPRPFQSDIERQRDQKAIYQAQLDAAQKEEKRLKELVSRGGATQSQVDKAEADARSLEAQLKANEQEIVRKSLDLEYARLTSPIAGRIGRAMMTEGNLVNAGGSDPLLATIVSMDPIYLYFSIDERSLQRYQAQRAASGAKGPASLKESQIKVRFRLETQEGYPYEAVMDFADTQIDRATGTVMARAVIANASGMLTPGSRVRIRVPTSAEHSVKLVPDTALLTDQDKKYLLVLNDKNVVQRRDVNIGRLLDDGMRVITPSGKAAEIGPNEWVIVLGLQMARINYPVEPVKPTADASKPAADPAKPAPETAKSVSQNP
jgi:multidrug efflux system membrane fusion protein